MSRLRTHSENHLVRRIGWLRAAVLGANDGIVSAASLIVGVAAAASKQGAILLGGSGFRRDFRHWSGHAAAYGRPGAGRLRDAGCRRCFARFLGSAGRNWR